MKTDTVTISQAARELHMSPQTLRYMMASGRIAIGDCGRRPGKKRGFYKVFRKMLDAEKERRGIGQEDKDESNSKTSA